MNWRHVLIVVAGLALAALGVGGFIVSRKVQREHERMLRQMECADALKTASAPPECAKLTGFDLGFARAMARCRLARDAARAAGTDPEAACHAAAIGSVTRAGGGAAP